MLFSLLLLLSCFVTIVIVVSAAVDIAVNAQISILITTIYVIANMIFLLFQLL